MHSFFQLRLLSSLLLTLLASSVSAECNVCSPVNNLACVSQTNFQVCENGLPFGPVDSCPTGYICSSTDGVICKPSSSNAVIACDECNKCDSGGVFACTGVRTYALCLGTTVPSTTTGTCASGYVCNVNYQQICGLTTMGIAPSCPTAGEVTTTTQAPNTVDPGSNPTAFCAAQKQTGRYPVGTNINNTCKQYVYCFQRNGSWSGQLYNCPGETFFDSKSGLCISSVPARCSA